MLLHLTYFMHQVRQAQLMLTQKDIYKLVLANLLSLVKVAILKDLKVIQVHKVQ